MYLVRNINTKNEVELPAFLINDLFNNKKVTVTKKDDWTFLKSKKLSIAVKPAKVLPITFS